MNRRIQCAWVVVLGVAIAHASPAQANRFGIHFDAGVGGSRTQPYVTGTAVSGTIGFGASTRLAGPVSACLEARASAGAEFPAGIPEDANAGRQSLVTFTGGFEVGGESHRGPFLASGLGVGHSTISGARGPTDSPDFGLVALEDRTAVAYDLGIGYRFEGGPGPLRAELALRTHGLFRDDWSASAHTIAVTIGFVHVVR